MGSTEFFELQHAAKYQGKDRIKIRQLWVPAAMVLESATNDQQSDEFVILRQEARHRLLEGKDILVFSRPQALMDWLVPKLKERGEAASARDHLFVDGGTLVPGFSLSADGAEFFCHSPFIEHCEDGDIIRNSAALVFRRRGFTYINTEETFSDFSLIASLRHDFYWLDVFTYKDHIRFTPQLSFTSGTQKFGFNPSSSTYATTVRTGTNVLFNSENVYLDDQIKFQPLSLTPFLRGEYLNGKFFIQPQLMLDYYFPANTDNFNAIFQMNHGFIF